MGMDAMDTFPYKDSSLEATDLLPNATTNSRRSQRKSNSLYPALQLSHGCSQLQSKYRLLSNSYCYVIKNTHNEQTVNNYLRQHHH